MNGKPQNNTRCWYCNSPLFIKEGRIVCKKCKKNQNIGLPRVPTPNWMLNNRGD